METHTIIKGYDSETGNKLINNYMILKEVGRGVHGKVKLAENVDTHQLVAIKIVDKKNRRRQMGYSLLRGGQASENMSEENEHKIKREISILKKCHHPNVVRLIEVIDVPTSRKIYMALEYIEKGEIEWRDELDQPILSIHEARRIFRDIVNGLDYLHYLGIIHRDIKPANILLSHDGVAKISDFGVSYYNELLAHHSHCTEDEEALRRMERELAETAGTPAFFAPELCCASEPKSPRISKAIDIWALGVTLYCFLYGRCPFIAATEFELFDVIPIQPLTFPTVHFEIPDNAKDLITRLLTKNPEDRITLDQVKVHPWVIEDLESVEEWLHQSDPRYYFQHRNVSMIHRIRQSIRKLSFPFSKKPRSPRPLSLQVPVTHDTTKHRLSQPIPHTITSITPTVSLSTGHTLVFNANTLRPISTAYLTEEASFEDYKRSRKISTASSHSGIGLTFGKLRNIMTPMEIPNK